MTAKAEIITIGDEILYGQTLDTNSHWMSGELDKAGIKVIRKTSIGDQKETILSTIREAESRADIILITGGLGPTNDDLTKPCMVEYFNTHLVRNSEVEKHIESLLKKFSIEVSEINRMQADIPENAIAIHNAMGTAPGMWFEKEGKAFICMPGVPYEMKRMMEDQIIPKLKDQFVNEIIHHRIIRTVGIGESKLAELIQDWETNLPSDIKLAYLPTTGMVKLRLTGAGIKKESVISAISKEVEKVLPLIDKYVYGYDDDELSEVIGKTLLEQGKKLAIAESCTGGYVSHLVTSIPGSSKWFNGGFVPYSNELKNEQLQVSNEILAEHGAVSEPVVLALAENVRKTFNADVGISISGIAGPGGGSDEKPVGTVWIAYADKDTSEARLFHFTKDRIVNIQFTATAALNMIRINLNKN